MVSQELVNSLLDSWVLVPVLIAGGLVLSLAIKTLGSTIRSVSREKTRREIAAYIAEGSLSPEQGERLMRAGESGKPQV
ncbi:MAG: hypothetical protein H7210_00725 [Pyrinomonadaceae bacterium]|nr:hypothetical protein [Phycisphaerales bacterium]